MMSQILPRPKRALSSPLLALLALSLTFASACSDDNNDLGPGEEMDSGMTTPDVPDDSDETPDTPDAPIDEMPDTPDVPPDVPDTPLDTPDDMPDMDPVDMQDDGPAVTLRLDALVPPRGALEGGTAVVIDGAGFSDQTVVFFGGRQASVDLVDGRLVGESPEGLLPGPVDVIAQDPATGEDTLVGGFTYVAGLGVDAVSPDRLPTTGNIEVTVYGRGFTEQTRVSFGGSTALRHTLVDPTLMRVLAPARAAGVVDVRLSSEDASVVLPEAVTYFETLRIDRARPASGPTSGGQQVTLSGGGFAPGMTVELGGAAATLTSVSPDGSEAVIMTPPGQAGLTAARVVTPTGDAALAQNIYLYTDAATPTLAQVQPSSGPASGGNDVTILGAQLDAPGVEITFGGQPAQILEVGPGHLVVRVPAGAIGAVDVALRDAGGATIATLDDGYTYGADLWLDRVMPSTGDVGGGELITLDGEGFTGATRVLFGANAAAFTIVSDAQITATAPPGAAGAVDVIVERGELRATALDGYLYSEDLRVYGFDPVRGSIAGNTYVEIRGRGFVGDLQVSFGGTPAARVDRLDSQTLAVRTPPGMTGPALVEVTRGQQTLAAPDPFTYFNPGARFGGAWGGPINGAVNVTVYSTSGAPIEGAFVMLSTRADTIYQGLTSADGLVTLSGPGVVGDQTITAVAAGHSSATVQRVNAENITIFLSPPPPPPQGGGASPQLPIFRGNIIGLNKIAVPGPGQFLMAVVHTTKATRGAQDVAPGSGNVVLADGPYTIRSRLGDVALIALGGIYDNNTQTFTPLLMGTRRFLFAADGGNYTGVDIELNIPLDKTMTVKLTNPPRAAGGPSVNVARPWLDLGFEGVFGELAVTSTQANLIQVPRLAPLTGVLADASYFVEAGAYASTDEDPPMSIAFKRNVTNLAAPVDMPLLLDVAQITSPAEGARPLNNLITFNYNRPNKPSLFYVILQDGQGLPRWEGFLPGTATSLRLPTFPDFSNLPPDQRPTPYPGEPLVLIILAIDQPGLDFNNFTYNALSEDLWDAYSFGFRIITL